MPAAVDASSSGAERGKKFRTVHARCRRQTLLCGELGDARVIPRRASMRTTSPSTSISRSGRFTSATQSPNQKEVEALGQTRCERHRGERHFPLFLDRLAAAQRLEGFLSRRPARSAAHPAALRRLAYAPSAGERRNGRSTPHRCLRASTDRPGSSHRRARRWRCPHARTRRRSASSGSPGRESVSRISNGMVSRRRTEDGAPL